TVTGVQTCALPIFAPVAPPGRRGPVEPIPEAWASVLVASPPAARAAAPFRTAAAVRRRGLEYSSIAKLIRARPAPITAIARPGGTYHHQAPASSAWEFCAKYSIDPQLVVVSEPSPRQAR